MFEEEKTAIIVNTLRLLILLFRSRVTFYITVK